MYLVFIANSDFAPVMHKPGTWFYRIAVCESRSGRLSSVKAIYSHVVDASRQYMSVSLMTMLCFKLDFSSCDEWDGFTKAEDIARDIDIKKQLGVNKKPQAWYYHGGSNSHRSDNATGIVKKPHTLCYHQRWY